MQALQALKSLGSARLGGDARLGIVLLGSVLKDRKNLKSDDSGNLKSRNPKS